LIFVAGLLLGGVTHAAYVSGTAPRSHRAERGAPEGRSGLVDGTGGPSKQGYTFEQVEESAPPRERTPVTWVHPPAPGAGTGGPTPHSLPEGTTVAASSAADGASGATATATAGAGAPPGGDASEAINAFKELAKEGLQAFGKAGALVERFRALGPDGVGLLSEMLRDPSSSSRFLAAAILEGLHDPASIAALGAATSDPDVLVQRMASHALAVMNHKDAVPSLERAMNEGADWGVRANAAYGLAKLGEKSGSDYLLAMWRDKKDPMAPMVALGALADVGSPEFSAELRPLIGDPAKDLGARLQAMLCAAKAKDKDAIPMLEGVIASPDATESLKDAARKAVNEITGEARHKVD